MGETQRVARFVSLCSSTLRPIHTGCRTTRKVWNQVTMSFSPWIFRPNATKSGRPYGVLCRHRGGQPRGGSGITLSRDSMKAEQLVSHTAATDSSHPTPLLLTLQRNLDADKRPSCSVLDHALKTTFLFVCIYIGKMF